MAKSRRQTQHFYIFLRRIPYAAYGMPHTPLEFYIVTKNEIF